MKIKHILLLLSLVIPALLRAQIKEASIIYDVKIEGLPPEQAALMGGMETSVTFKNGKTLTEISSTMYTQQIYADENGMLMLMEQLGNRYAVRQTSAEIDQEAARSNDNVADAKIEYVDETRTIAGYECKKAVLTFIDKDRKTSKVELWYCDKFVNPNIETSSIGISAMKSISGLPVEYSTTMGAMKIKMVAQKISTEPVADSIFYLNTAGYKMLTIAELKAMKAGK